MSVPAQLRPRMIQFAKLDLGQRMVEGGCLVPSSSVPQRKVWYPSLWIDSKKGLIDLPNSGKAVVDYKVVRRTTEERDGESTQSATIEIHSIESVDVSTRKLKPGAARPLKLFSSLTRGMISFDSRPRDPMGQFAPQAEGGPDPATMRAAYGPSTIGKAAAGAGVGLGGTAAALLLAGRLRMRRLAANKLA